MSAPESAASPERKRPVFLTDAQRMTIVAACATGAHKGQLAERFNIRPEVISRLLKRVKTVQDPANPLAPANYREMLRMKAVAGVVDGVDCEDDPYKRGQLSCRVLEGIGEFNTPGQSTVNVAVINATPAELRDRYLSCHDTSTASIESANPLQVVCPTDIESA